MVDFRRPGHNCVVIMDNCSIHHIHKVTSTIRETGAIYIFCPPTHLTIILLKKHFKKSKVKTVMKTMEVWKLRCKL